MRKDANIDKKISLHISRHSFAKMAKDKGLDNLEVKALLAHSNLATTQRYMGEFDTARTDAALEKVFESKDKKSKEEKLLEYLRKVDPTILQDVLKKLTKQS
jgi:integrase